jgi:3-oxoacyl-[acyl-carrier-protein] synthase I
LTIRIGAIGLVTPVGHGTAASLAAIRAGIDAFQELPVPNPLPQTLIGAQVPRVYFLGVERLLALLEPALREATAHLAPAERPTVPLLLALSHPGRPDRPKRLERDLVQELQRRLGWGFPRGLSAVIALGRAGGLAAIGRAARLLREGKAARCLVAGVDSLVNDDMMGWLFQRDRLKVEDNSNGLIPGEAAAVVELVREAQGAALTAGDLVLLGCGEAREHALVGSGEPCRADGLVAAVRAALADAGLAMHDIDYRLSDLTGEHYHFKETANALLRLLRERKPAFPLWHPADCIGDSGAASGPLLVAIARAAAAKGYAPGPRVVCQGGSDEGLRAACVLQAVAARGDA